MGCEMAKLTGAARDSAVLRIATELAKVLLAKSLERGSHIDHWSNEMAIEEAEALAKSLVDKVYK